MISLLVRWLSEGASIGIRISTTITPQVSLYYHSNPFPLFQSLRPLLLRAFGIISFAYITNLNVVSAGDLAST